MDPIVSNLIATASEAGTSSQSPDIAAGLLLAQGKLSGKGTGKAGRGIPEPAGLSTFAGMLKMASRKSSLGRAQSSLAGGEATLALGKSAGKTGNPKAAAFADGEVAMEAGMNLYALLQGMGLPQEQVDKILSALAGALSRREGASAGEKEMAGEKIGALLAANGLAREKIERVLSALANGTTISPSPLPAHGAPQEKGRRTERAAPGQTSEEIAFAGMGQGISSPGDTREKIPAGLPTIKGAPEGTALPGKQTPVSGAEKEMAPGGGCFPVPEMKGAGNETPKLPQPQAEGGDPKRQAVSSLREGLPDKGAQAINAAPPVVEGQEEGTMSGEKSLPAGEEAVTKGMETGPLRVRAKQRSLFKEGAAGMGQSEEGRGRLSDEKAVIGKNGALPEPELTTRKTGGACADDEKAPLSAQGKAAGENGAASRVEPGSLFTVVGGSNDVKAETAPGLRPEVVIDQIAAQVGQLPQGSPGRIKITLSPPHLGTLDMDVLIRSNKVEVVMIASSQEVQQVLKAHGDQLRNALQGQGFKMDGFDVMLQGNHAGPQYRFRESSFTREGRGERGADKGGAGASGTGSVLPARGRDIARGDGISLFI